MAATRSPQAPFEGWLRSVKVVDVALAAVVLCVSVAQIAHGGVTPTHPVATDLDWLGAALAACSALPLLGWRRSAYGAFLMTGSASVLLAGFGYPADLLLGPAVALYLLAASRTAATPWTRRSTAVVLALLIAYLVATAAAHGTFPGIELLHTGLAWAGAWFAGERTRLRREQMADLRERARIAEHEGERERLLAVAEERARIARDLHDTAGNAISLIAVRAGAARLRHQQDPDRSLRALEAVEELARDTAEEINQIVATLREGGTADGTVEPPHGLASLDALIAKHRAARLDVTHDTTGVPRPLGAAADQAAYRIIQEALTNAARHGAGSARIAVQYVDNAVELTVTNPVANHGAPRSSGGHGLIGMRERATLLGGTFDAERANGGFRVHARIPCGGNRT